MKNVCVLALLIFSPFLLANAAETRVKGPGVSEPDFSDMALFKKAFADCISEALTNYALITTSDNGCSERPEGAGAWRKNCPVKLVCNGESAGKLFDAMPVFIDDFHSKDVTGDELQKDGSTRYWRTIATPNPIRPLGDESHCDKFVRPDKSTSNTCYITMWLNRYIVEGFKLHKQ